MDARRDVLVVEDDEALNQLVCACVELAGYPHRSAFDGHTALREANETPPALVLLDLMLPDTTGFEICQKLKDDHRTENVPVVLVTALNDEQSRRLGRKFGAVEYIVKPFSTEQIIETIKKHAA